MSWRLWKLRRRTHDKLWSGSLRGSSTWKGRPFQRVHTSSLKSHEWLRSGRRFRVIYSVMNAVFEDCFQRMDRALQWGFFFLDNCCNFRGVMHHGWRSRHPFSIIAGISKSWMMIAFWNAVFDVSETFSQPSLAFQSPSLNHC